MFERSLKLVSDAKSWLTSRFAAPNLENPNTPLTGANLESGYTLTTNSGQTVTPHTALTYSPVWCAVSTISDSVARIPLISYRRDFDGGRPRRQPALRTTTYWLLNYATDPNPNAPKRLTSRTFIAKLLASALLYPAGYAVITRDKFSTPLSLEWVPSWRVAVYQTQDTGAIYYIVHDHNGRQRTIQRPDMFVLHGLSIEELGGLSIIEYARNTIGRQMSMERYEDDFFKNHAVPTGNFTHPGEMSAEAQKRFISQMVRLHGGAGNRHKFGILEEGMTWQDSGISPKDAMLVDQLKFGIPEIARFYRMPLHLLADPSRQGYNTTEAENEGFVNMCLGNWMSRIESEATDRLFSQSLSRRNEFFAEFQVDKVFRPSTQDRYNSYATGIQWGILNRNEARVMENLDPYDGGDEYILPLNFQFAKDAESAGQDDDDEAPEPTAPETQQTDEQDSAQRILIDSQFKRMSDRITKAACDAVRKPGRFLSFVNDIEDRHQVVIRSTVEPIARLCAAITGEDKDEITEMAVSEMVRFAVDAYLEAAECKPDELERSVANTNDTVAAKYHEIGRNILCPQEDTQAVA